LNALAGKVIEEVRVTVEPGVCGFQCTILAKRIDNRRVRIGITGSGCKSVNQMATFLEDILLRDLFAPPSRNPVFLSAERARCHPSCPVPVGVLKAAECAMEMALARPAYIRFER
jgi:Family of unknown function (DUF6951)